MKNKIISIFITISLLIMVTTGCLWNTADYCQMEKTEFLMGTLVTIKVYEKNKDKGNLAIDKALERIREIEGLMSVNIENSEIQRINQKAGMESVSVSGDTFKVIEKGLYYGELSKGLFDITVGPLVNLWGIGTEYERVPGAVELKNALRLVNYKDVELNVDGFEVFLKRPHMALDLGGIAKGYAADEAKKVLVSAGVGHAIINLGGNVLTLGQRYDGGPWNIGVKDPGDPAGSLLGTVKVIDGTVVTSGDYERYFERDGRVYHHIMDPRTGYPGQGSIKSIVIINSSSIDADALSTTVFLMDIEKGMELIEGLDGVEAVAITRNGRVVSSSGIGDSFNVTKNDYMKR